MMIAAASSNVAHINNFVINGIDLIGCNVTATNSDHGGSWNCSSEIFVSCISSSSILLIVTLVWIGLDQTNWGIGLNSPSGTLCKSKGCGISVLLVILMAHTGL